MIRAVFFDFYGTLAHWSPEAEGIQRRAAAEEGIDVDEASIARAYFTANAFMDAENARSPLRERLPAEVDAFFAEYERLLIRTAGAETTLETAWRIWTRVRAAPKEMALYPDAKATLAELRGMGLKLGVISNVGAELDGWLDRLGVGGDLPVRATSGNTGSPSPIPPSSGRRWRRWAWARARQYTSATARTRTSRVRSGRGSSRYSYIANRTPVRRSA